MPKSRWPNSKKGDKKKRKKWKRKKRDENGERKKERKEKNEAKKNVTGIIDAQINLKKKTHKKYV